MAMLCIRGFTLETYARAKDHDQPAFSTWTQVMSSCRSVVLPLQVQLSWPGLPVNGSNACSGDVVWPLLDGVIILGGSQPLSTSFTLQVGTATIELRRLRRLHVAHVGRMCQGSCHNMRPW